MSEIDAEVFKALADENRLAIVRMVGSCGEACACDLLADLNISQPTLSHHMKVLCSCGMCAAGERGRLVPTTR